MHYTQLGRSGLKVSRICLGMMSYGTPEWRDWVLSEDDARPIVARALEAGINFFDTADMYSRGASEVVTGRLLREMANREEMVVATKVYFPENDKPNRGGLGRKHIFHAIDNSLKRLGMDYVDLYQIHRWDYSTPIEETMEALHEVVRSGKARYIGASSMWAWQFGRAQHIADMEGWTRFISMQNHYNLIYREEEREMNPQCLHMGVGLIPWSPLARGFLAGNRTPDRGGETTRSRSDDYAHRMYYQDADFAVLEAVRTVAGAREIRPAQAALAWLLHKPAVSSPIIGATKMYQLEEAVAAVDLLLSEDEIAMLEAPYVAHPVLGHS